MIRLKILWLRWRAFWAQIAVEIDEAEMARVIPSLERNLARLARIEGELDQLYAPRSLIVQALDRAKR